MAETTDSLRTFFGTDALKLSPAQRAKLEERLQGYPAIAAKFTNNGNALTKELDKLLDISFGDIFSAAWNKARELSQYTDQTRYPPDQVNFVPLLKHTIQSEHKPSVELLVNNQLVVKLSFSVALECELKGFELKIQGGKILEIKTGTATGTGKISCEGVELLEKKGEPIRLPGYIGLGEGVPITW